MGFTDPDWESVFYPRDIKPGGHLAFYARYFDTVELDTTFHAEPTVERVRRWADGRRLPVRTSSRREPRVLLLHRPWPGSAVRGVLLPGALPGRRQPPGHVPA